MTNKQAKYIYDCPLNNLINEDKIFVFYFIIIKMVTVLFLTFLYAGLAQVEWFRLHFHISFYYSFQNSVFKQIIWYYFDSYVYMLRG